MIKECIHQDRLQWTKGWSPEPIWPREPDVIVVKSLAIKHLAAELPATLDNALLEVTFFAEGGFNKLYQISYSGHHTSYLLRAALPIEPYYKTECEVATIAYLRGNTSIPVPRVFAWESNSDNELTFEWILMEKLDGIPLYDLWPRKVPWDRKLELTEKVAKLVKELRYCQFDRIGGLYFKSALDRGTARHEKAQGSNSVPIKSAVGKHWDAGVKTAETSQITTFSGLENLNIDTRRTGDAVCPTAKLQSKQSVSRDSAGTEDHCRAGGTAITDILLEESEDTKSVQSMDQAEFSIDRIFDPLFFMGSRLYLPGNRGPYQSSLEWLNAEIRVQLEWIKNGPIEDDEDNESDFAEEAPMMERICHEYINILPTVFGDIEGKGSFTLYHSDLNAANILVHPETFEITGIVDWEMINVVPAWRVSEYPKFLEYMEPDKEEEPPIPSEEVNKDDIAVELRDRWEHRTLRHHFDKITERSTQYGGDGIDDTMKTKAKRDCHGFIAELTGMWTWSENWLKTYKTTGISKNQADWAQETYDSDNES